MNTLNARFLALPRAAQWLVWAALGLGVYFLAVQPSIDAIIRLNARAENARGELGVDGRERAAREQAASQIRTGATLFGAVAFPGEPAERSEALTRRVNEVLARHAVNGDRRVTRTAPLDAGAMDATIGIGRRIDRIIMDLQFDASPEQAAAVLADLESTPEVASVSRIQVRRDTGSDTGSGGRTLRVSLSAEAWVVARKEGGR